MDRFARLIHRLDFVFEALRGNHRAELAVITNDNSYASGHHRPRDARNESGRLGSDCADANPVGLRRYTSVANIILLLPGSEIDPRRVAHGYVVPAGGVIGKGTNPSAVLLPPVVLAPRAK